VRHRKLIHQEIQHRPYPHRHPHGCEAMLNRERQPLDRGAGQHDPAK
jgi:hypothetical protein